MDKFYSSPNRYAKLEVKQIGACGTVKGNRRQMPDELLQKNLKLKKGDDPVFMRSRNLVVCGWHMQSALQCLAQLITI